VPPKSRIHPPDGPRRRSLAAPRPARSGSEGWQGWDEYAPFYDWENARTQGRRDVPFWRRLTSGVGGLVLELGSGTGRLSLPLARAGASLVGIDRSAPMLSRAGRGAASLRA
jgi:SAM-dependent methyltransferase